MLKSKTRGERKAKTIKLTIVVMLCVFVMVLLPDIIGTILALVLSIAALGVVIWMGLCSIDDEVV